MTTEEDSQKKLEDLQEKKEVAFYQAGVAAWYNTALEHDKSLCTLSVGGIGLLMTLIRTMGVPSAETLVLYVLALIFFLVCLVSVLVIFKKNKSHIEHVIQDTQDAHINDSLVIFDNVAIWSFGLAVLLSAVIGVSSAVSSYTTKVTQMAKEDDKKQIVPTCSNANSSKSAPENLEPGLESFSGISKLKMQSKVSQPKQATSSTSSTPSSQATSNKKDK